MDGQGLRMCRFTRDGIPELGEYLESVDGTGICKLTELDGGGEEVVVCLPDGTMPEGISDLELVRVPTRIEEGDAKTETMSDETAESRFIHLPLRWIWNRAPSSSVFTLPASTFFNVKS